MTAVKLLLSCLLAALCMKHRAAGGWLVETVAVAAAAAGAVVVSHPSLYKAIAVGESPAVEVNQTGCC